MNTLIPLEYYYPLYINLCLFLVLFTLLHTRVLHINSTKNLQFINVCGYFILIFLILYMGLRPVHITFGDTVNYNRAFQSYSLGEQITEVEDYGWHVFMKFCSTIMSVHFFFLICAFLYIYPLYKISKTFFDKYWYYAFIMFIISFSFWTYGVNGVRNGAACSFSKG